MESLSEQYRPRSPTLPSQLLHKPDSSTSQARSISASRTVSKDRGAQEGEHQYLPTPTSLPNSIQHFGSARPSVSSPRHSTVQNTLLEAENRFIRGGEQEIEDEIEAREERTESVSEPRHVADGGLPFAIDMDIEVLGDDTEQRMDVEDRTRVAQA